MADNSATAVVSTGNVIPELAGAGAGADTLPAGTAILMRNTGAGAHVVTIVNNGQIDNLASSNRVHNLAAGQIKVARVPAVYGDANGRAGISVDGSAAEVKYYLIGA